MFIRIIEQGKIKETLFCICNLLSKKYFNTNVKEKIKITIEEYTNKVSIKMYENDIDLKFNTEINFFKMENIIKQVKKYNKKGWNNIEINSKSILTIGKNNNISKKIN